ncbi:collagen binding domain-containing protein [Phenylobacterium sp.]|uniref:collagen binding domain-containing protein n=1 Tax=Phenylobacterium sp. TaxID=1871053 RepID=UPI003782E419
MRNRSRRCVAWSATAALAIFRASQGAAAEAAAQAQPAPPPAASPAAAPPAGAGELDPATLLLLSVDLDDLTLTDGLTAYGDPQDPHLAVGELTRLLEMDVEVLPTERRIIGRLGEARRSLVVDLKSGMAQEAGRNIPLAPGDVVANEGDIFVRASVLQRMLPMKFQVDPEALAVKIVPSELLPVQSRMQRLARRRDAMQQFEAKNEVLKAETPYRLFSLPAFDMVLGVGAENSDNRFPLRYDIRVGADLLYTGFQGYVGSDENGRPATARLTLERRSVEGRLLGPLKARAIAVGDVFTPGLALGPRSMGGRGMAISTVPLDETNIFNRIDLRGELPLGYDVELYVNNILRSGQNTPAKGRYEFLNVPLSQGLNVIRIVTYGPRGERSESTRIVNVGGGVLRRGEATFELGVVQQEENLIRFRNPDADQTFNNGRGGLRAAANLNYGLTSTLTLAAAAAYIPGETRKLDRQLYALGLRTSLFGFSTQIDAGYDSFGGTAASLGMAGQLFGVSTVLRHAEFQGGFIDENGIGVDITRPLTRRSELTFDGNLGLFRAVIPLSVRGVRTQYADGQRELLGSLRGSGTGAGILYSGGLEFQRITGRGATTNTLNGFFAGSTYRGYKWQLRSSLDFQILPELEARSLAITADRDISETVALRFGVGQPLNDLKGFNLTAASIFRLRFADLALNGEYNNGDQVWRLGAQLNFGLGYNPAIGRYEMTRPGPGSGGSVLFEAFLDRNGNGIFDGDDEPVPNIVLEGADRRVRTGANGRAFVTGVGAGPTARLLVGLDEVENTSVQAPPTTVQFSPRAGSFTTVRYPMKPTGEVLVLIQLRRPDGSLVGLSAAQVQLVGDNGYTADSTTEFDGSASFENLPVGTYKVVLEPEQAARLRMSLLEPHTVVIKGDGGFAPDVKAEVKFAPRSQENLEQTQ